MEHYAGLDVSLEETSLCIVDDTGKIFREAKVPSEPAALVSYLSALELKSCASGRKLGRCHNGCKLR